MSNARAVNLLGALTTALHDALEEATVGAAGHGAAGPAAFATLHGEPGLSIGALSRILGLSHSGAVRLLDRLEGEGSVERKAGPDGRTAALHLTAAGRRRARAVQTARQDALEAALTPLSVPDRAQLLRLTEQLLAGITRDRTHSDHICRLCDLEVCPDARCPVAGAVRADQADA